MEEQEKNIQDYLAIVSRRKIPMIVIASVVFTLGVVIALLWPPTYNSTATILIKEQEIPTELVRSTVTSYAAQRIQTISQRVMTRTNLMQIVEKYNLYKKDRKRKTTEEVLEEMRADIGLSMVDAQVIDPRSGQPTKATIAFKLSFLSSSPAAAQKVAGELTSLFLAENLKTRKEKATETFVFLTSEAEKLSNKISELENKMASFKDEYANSLPEMSAMNQSMMNRTESELVQADAELRSLQERKFFMESQLAQINPLTNMRSATGISILDPVSRLKALESEYASLTAKYSDQHPDVIKVKREIEGLKTQTGMTTSISELAKSLTAKRAQLGVLLEKYSDQHPDVIKLQKEVGKLEKEIARGEKLPERKVIESTPDNPAYISVQTQINTVNAEIKSVEERKASLKAKVLEYESRLAKAPQVEREFLLLKREHANASMRYQDIKARQMEAEIGQQLEKESKGESFLLIDPAQYPEKPVKPNRIAIVFLSFVFSIACGLGYAFLAEKFDSSVKGVSGVAYMLTVAPLAVIPEIFTPTDYFRKKRVNRILIGSTLAGFILVILAIHFFYSPLDVLWFRGVRKAENLIGV